MEAVAYSNVGFLTLMVATFVLATTHTLSPDHWFPFVLVARANKWTLPMALTLACLAGLGHVLTSVAIGLVGVFAEAGLSKDIAQFFENATPMLLIIFGFGYAAYAFYKQRVGAHGHSHGIPIINKWLGIDPHAYELPEHDHDHEDGLHIGHVNLYLHNMELHIEINHDDHLHGYDATKEENHDHRHAHGDEAVHEHKHSHRESGIHEHDHGEEHEHSHDSHSHAHDEHDHDHDDHGHSHKNHGHDHEEHGHDHNDHEHHYEHNGHEHDHKKTDLKDRRAGWGLVIILALTPCIALLPLTFAAVKYGTMAVILVNISFTVGTVLTIMLFTWLGLKGLSWIKFEFFEEYGDIIAGVIIGLLGIATKVLEL
jgi:hypothetical protein